ncbi:hypothetical protein AMTRI_Chr03g54350 [Amborella trichopoda]
MYCYAVIRFKFILHRENSIKLVQKIRKRREHKTLLVLSNMCMQKQIFEPRFTILGASNFKSLSFLSAIVLMIREQEYSWLGDSFTSPTLSGDIKIVFTPSSKTHLELVLGP